MTIAPCRRPVLREGFAPGMWPAEPDRVQRQRWIAYLDRVTTAHQAATAAGLAPALVEAAVLAEQIPACFQPPRRGDLIAGRCQFPPVGFSPEPGGCGWYCRADVLERWSVLADTDAGERAVIARTLAWWRPHHTAAGLRACVPAEADDLFPAHNYYEGPGACWALFRLGGCQLDFPTLLADGLPGLRRRLAAARRAEADAAFLAGLERTVDILAATLDGLAGQARGATDDDLELLAMADACAAVAAGRPRTLRQAMQLGWIAACAAGTLNYGRMDDWLGPFLAADLADGRLDEAGAQRLVDDLWRLIAGRATIFNGRVAIGGLGRRDPLQADRFALLAIRATRRLRGIEPQLTLRFHPGQDPALMDEALAALGEGCTYPLLYNDAVNVPAVERAFAIPRALAESYLPYGCGEYMLDHASLGTPNAIVNCAALLLRALDEAPADAAFAQVVAGYQALVERAAEACAAVQAATYRLAAGAGAFLPLSLLTDDCIARGRALLDGGVRHLGGTWETYGNTTVADSLVALRTVVYEQRRASLAEVRTALAADWRGHEALWHRLHRAPKFGNDDPDADDLLCRLHDHLCRATAAAGRRHGLDSFLVVVVNNKANTQLGWSTGATPDGRCAGMPLTNGNCPNPGCDREGPSALLASLAKPDPGLHAGAVQHLKLARSWFAGGHGQVQALLAGYWAAGGAQLIITVSDPGELQAAMERPEDYGHLLVRVGGFSARFVDLPRNVQAEVAARALH